MNSTSSNSGASQAEPCDFERVWAQGGRLYWALQARAVLLRAIRQYFDRRGFVEVDPPMLATSPGLELHLDAMVVHLRAGMAGAAVQRYLVTSPEYHCKRLLSSGLDQIYSLQHAFRSGERGGHHNPEFMMLEWYRTHRDWRAIVRDVRGLVRHCARALQTPALQPLRDLPGLRLPVAVDQPWPVMAVRQALRRWADLDPGDATDLPKLVAQAQRAGLDVRPGDTIADILVQALVERVEPQLVHLPAIVLAPWPVALASLARQVPGKPTLAERFEVYLGGVEVANGFSELTDPHEQRARFEADLAARRRLGKPIYPIDERFLAALHRGMPPAGGVALGVDRLLMALTGIADIAQVQPFAFEVA